MPSTAFVRPPRNGTDVAPAQFLNNAGSKDVVGALWAMQRRMASQAPLPSDRDGQQPHASSLHHRHLIDAGLP
jgi:hypothetical protein